MRKYTNYILIVLVLIITAIVLFSVVGSQDNSEVGTQHTTSIEVVETKSSPTEIESTTPPIKSNIPAENLAKTSLTDEMVKADNNNFLILLWITGLSTFLSIILGLISWNLYRWRIRITNEQALFVPEAQIERSDKQIEKLNKLQQLLPELVKKISREGELQLAKTTELEEMLLQFQNSLDAKDEEIKRLKEGYDVKLYSRFLVNFFRLYKTIWRFEKDSNFPGHYSEQLLMQLDDAFENAGVELFYPDTGLNFRDYNHFFRGNPKTVVTNKPEQDLIVESIITPGLRLVDSTDNIIIQAEASIYVYEED